MEFLSEPYSEAVIFDTPQYRNDGYLWCHLTAFSVDYLHNFASKIGLKREWFQDYPGRPHYDIKSNIIRRAAAHEGAKLVTRKYFIEYLNHHHGVRSL